MVNIRGSFVAVATPYRGGKVDFPAIRDLVDFHLRSGTNGICPAATTGESPVLTTGEKAEIIRTVVKMVRGKIDEDDWSGRYLPRSLKDGWGRDLHYKIPGPAGNPFQLYSLGADNQPGGKGVNADISNIDESDD